MRNFSRYLLLALLAVGCMPQDAAPTLTSTPAIVLTPTVQIRNSEELYGDAIRDGQNDPTAAALPSSGSLPPQQIGTAEIGAAQAVEVVLRDGQMIEGRLHISGDTLSRVPGVLLLNPELATWGDLPRQLQAAGYTVLLVNSDTIPTEDMESLFESLSEIGSVDPGRIAVIGAEAGADLALLGCTVDPICDAAVLLSPRAQETLVNVLPSYNPRPLFLAAAQNDAEGFNTAAALARSFAEGSQFVEMATGTGTGLLALNSSLSREIIDWLNVIFQP